MQTSVVRVRVEWGKVFGTLWDLKKEGGVGKGEGRSWW